MSTKIHLTISIDWLLDEDDWPDEELCKYFTRDGEKMSAAEARECLREELAKGHKKMLLGSGPCEGFSPVTGCPGHELEN